MTSLAWLGALAIGLTLGLLGSGGSILTVPVLVYIVGEPDKIAIAESLAIVGLVAVVGAVPYAWRGQVSWATVLLFGLPGMAGSFVGALAAKSVPGRVQLTLFAVLMLGAALSLLRPTPARRSATLRPARPNGAAAPASSPAPRRDGDGDEGKGALRGAQDMAETSAAAWANYRVLATQGFGVGTLTGLVGVGGGFLVIPALVLLLQLPMHVAVGTSLSIVALNAASGFFKHAQVLHATGLRMNLHLIVTFAALGIAGSLTGSAIGQHLPQHQLRRVFAVFVLLVGGFVLTHNLAR